MPRMLLKDLTPFMQSLSRVRQKRASRIKALLERCTYISLSLTSIVTFSLSSDYFQELIKKSQQDLDSTFKKIYGVHYEQNTKLFMDFFVDLTSYYRGTTGSDINGIMDAFFTKLMGRMFQIMNTQYKFTESYLSCVSRQVDELRPFGEVPEKLKPQIRKVLIHARTFSKALFDGRDVIHMLKTAVSASENCKNHLVKLKYCSWCKAMTSLKPCYKFCTDVHKSCLVDITRVNTLWQGYIGALNDLLEKQTGPTNIQDVISRLNLKISLGIMNFQDSQKMEEVKKKVRKWTSWFSEKFCSCFAYLIEAKIVKSIPNVFGILLRGFHNTVLACVCLVLKPRVISIVYLLLRSSVL